MPDMWVRALLVSAAFLLAGCGDGQASPADGSPAPRGTAPAGGATARPTAAASRGLRLVRVGSFQEPLFVTAPPGDRRRVFVVEKTGRIRVIRDGRKLSRPFLDLSGRVSTGSEQGLLSMAFAPDYRRSRRFYVDYTDKGGDSRIVEYEAASPDRADPRSARQVLRVDQPEANHNGGQISFGPDGLLYVAFGDGGGGGDRHGRLGNGQSLSTLLGKILRIDPRPSGGRPYRVPSSNPFVGRSGARPEIYSYGLRNPWRFAFDSRTGDLAIGDVGQNEIEEIDFVRRGDGAGANFGWRPFEGSRVFAEGERAEGHVEPVIERTHGAGWCSITGGVFVRDPDLRAHSGRYLFGDFCVGRVYGARLARPRARDVKPLGVRGVDAISSFGEDARRRVYVTSLSGPVYRLAAR